MRTSFSLLFLAAVSSVAANRAQWCTSYQVPSVRNGCPAVSPPYSITSISSCCGMDPITRILRNLLVKAMFVVISLTANVLQGRGVFCCSDKQIDDRHTKKDCYADNKRYPCATGLQDCVSSSLSLSQSNSLLTRVLV